MSQRILKGIEQFNPETESERFENMISSAEESGMVKATDVLRLTDLYFAGLDTENQARDYMLKLGKLGELTLILDLTRHGDDNLVHPAEYDHVVGGLWLARGLASQYNDMRQPPFDELNS